MREEKRVNLRELYWAALPLSGGMPTTLPVAAAPRTIEAGAPSARLALPSASRRLSSRASSLVSCAARAAGHRSSANAEPPNPFWSVVPPSTHMIFTSSTNHWRPVPATLQLQWLFTNSLGPPILSTLAWNSAERRSMRGPSMSKKGFHSRWPHGRPPALNVSVNRTVTSTSAYLARSLFAQLLLEGIHAGTSFDTSLKASAPKTTLHTVHGAITSFPAETAPFAWRLAGATRGYSFRRLLQTP